MKTRKAVEAEGYYFQNWIEREDLLDSEKGKIFLEYIEVRRQNLDRPEGRLAQVLRDYLEVVERGEDPTKGYPKDYVTRLLNALDGLIASRRAMRGEGQNKLRWLGDDGDLYLIERKDDAVLIKGAEELTKWITI